MESEHVTSLGGTGSSPERDDLAGEPASLVRRVDGRGEAPGDVLAGRYRIVGLLGEGGMGRVWRARSLVLDVDVAIKVLHRERADLNAAERLLREARATAKLGHPAIVRVFDLGQTEGGDPFLVMELLEGMSLAGWLEGRGRMSATQAVQMLLPIAGALAAAHKQGIVHRDIKPENIIIVPDGEGAYLPKIVDFGIAKLVDGSARGAVLTQSGMILGSMEYMSPEQAEGRDGVGEQTDIWALCVVLYELISGRRPFDGPTVTALMFALYTSAPTPTTRYAAGDDELWEIIEHGLQKSPHDRWPTMRALGHALASWASRRGVTTDAAGMSLEHHWLGGISEPPLVPETVPTSTASPGVALLSPRGAAVSAPSIVTPPAAREIAAPPAVLAAVLPAAQPPEPPVPRRRSRLVGPAAALFILVSLLLFAGLYAYRAGTSASARTAPDPAPAAPATMAIVVTPAPVATPSAAVAEIPVATTAPPPIKPQPPRTTPASPSKRAPRAMPLPATPDF